MPKYLTNSESSEASSLIPVSIDSYISVLDLLRRLILQIAFSFGRPQLTNQNAGSARKREREPQKTNIRSKSKVISEDDRRWCDRRVLLQILCVPSDSHISQAAVYTSPK